MSVLPFPSGQRVPEFDESDRLRKSAKVAGLTNRQIAAALGVNEATVSGWINGQHRPSRQTLMIWSQMTDVDYYWLRDGVCTPRDLNPEPTDSGTIIPIALYRKATA